MHYILLISVLVGVDINIDERITSIEFGSENACINAKNILLNKEHQESHGSYIVVSADCLAKGE